MSTTARNTGQRVCMRCASAGLSPAAASAACQPATSSISRLPCSRKSTATVRGARLELHDSGQPTWVLPNSSVRPPDVSSCRRKPGP
jgi:hypothetical protein